MASSQKVIITNTLLEQGKSDNGGWSDRQLRCLGIKTRFKRKGWKWDLIGQKVSQSKAQRFLELRNAHLDKPYNGPFRLKDEETTAKTRAIFRELGKHPTSPNWPNICEQERLLLMDYAGQSRFDKADLMFVSRMAEKINRNSNVKRRSQ